MKARFVCQEFVVRYQGYPVVSGFLLCPAVNDIRATLFTPDEVLKFLAMGPKYASVLRGSGPLPGIFMYGYASSHPIPGTGQTGSRTVSLFITKYGPVFTDGSCYYQLYPEITYAGGAAAQYDDKGNVINGFPFQFPYYLPQNAATAEQYTATAAQSLS